MNTNILLATTIAKKKPIIWTISGADCSGGAGIAADIKTGHNLNVEVCHLITANTVQNSAQLIAINPVDINILVAQAQALRFDKPPAAIKIGLIVNTEQLAWLTTLLVALKQQVPTLVVVYDPVGQASVGGNLTSLTAPLLQPLLPLVDVITPNIFEAKQLAGLEAKNSSIEHVVIAEKILLLGCKAAIIKGGHNDNTKTSDTSVYCRDLCLQQTDSTSRLTPTPTKVLKLQSPRVKTSYSHGGGCSFASALASFLAHGYLLRDAFTLTKAFINQGLSANSDKLTSDNTQTSQHYYGAFEQGQWPTTPAIFPLVISQLYDKYQTLPAFPLLNLPKKEKLGLYPVIDSLNWLEHLLPLNLNIIQLRIKNKSTDELESIIAKAVVMAAEYSCRLFINDHWQLAIKYGAYGVHIGQEDLANADLTTIAKSGLRLGISTHGCYEFLLAKQLQPSYLAIGAIFPTKTKDMTGQIQGVKNLKYLVTLADNIPIVAIGGISQDRIEKVRDTGVSGVAVVTAITEAEQPIITAMAMQALLRE